MYEIYYATDTLNLTFQNISLLFSPTAVTGIIINLRALLSRSLIVNNPGK